VSQMQTFNSWKVQFDNLVELASALPWSTQNGIYEGLSRLLIDHIVMTSIGHAVNEKQAISDLEIQKSAISMINEASKKCSVSLINSGKIVELYLSGLLRPDPDIKIVPSLKTIGIQKCEWIMGCPVVSGGPKTPHRPLQMFCCLEMDHIYSKARKPMNFNGNKAQLLCGYHNREWKGAHISFAFPDSMIECKKK